MAQGRERSSPRSQRGESLNSSGGYEGILRRDNDDVRSQQLQQMERIAARFVARFEAMRAEPPKGDTGGTIEQLESPLVDGSHRHV